MDTFIVYRSSLQVCSKVQAWSESEIIMFIIIKLFSSIITLLSSLRLLVLILFNKKIQDRKVPCLCSNILEAFS